MTSIPKAPPEGWALEELVGEANRLMPRYLPEDARSGSGRLRDEITPRLVRHYTTQGLLDPPGKAGRENRYTLRHLLQVLTLRKLQAEGYRGSALETQLRSDDEELEMLLEGSSRFTKNDNPALAYMRNLQVQHEYPISQRVLGLTASDSEPKPTRRRKAKRWYRLEVEPGFELFLREDYRPPTSPREKELLWQHITALMEETRRKS